MVMLAITVAATMTILVVRFGHRPLYRIARTLRDISTNNLDRRLALKDAPQELLPVINEINDMLQRLESSYERLSHYSADIAHELKTPVNNLMTQMQVILSRDRSIDNYKETLYSALEECEHMAQMINDLLFLAKADDLTHSLDLKPVPIKTEIENMIDYYAPLAEERHINFKIEGQDIEVIAEPVLLRRALSNLYANAINYSPPNTVVNTRIYAENQNKKLKETLFVEIENTVTPTIEFNLNKLFDRFYRAQSAALGRDNGIGLGLAITKSIIEVMDGKIRANRLGNRIIFELQLRKCNP
jgi:two-component system heavy metal sensor histidine kinase CusS